MSLQDSLARLRLLKRQGGLLVIAIVIPCLLLVGLSVRMLLQERELADKRAIDDRRQLAAQVRQHLLTYFERVKLDALSSRVVPVEAGRGSGDANRALALVATIDEGQLVLPWDRRAEPGAAEAATSESAFAQAMRAGERAESVTRRFDDAADAYRHAMAIAPASTLQAMAQLALARTLSKAGRAGDASAAFRQLLRQPLRLVDDEAMPFALYAAGRLLAGAAQSGADAAPHERSGGANDDLNGVRTEILTLLRQASEDHATSPAALHMAGELAGRVAQPAGPGPQGPDGDLPRLIADRAVDVEQAEALRAAFPTLTSSTVFSTADPVWLPFGSDDRLWLVTVTPSLDGTERLLVAARSEPAVAAFDEQIRSGSTTSPGKTTLNIRAEGEPLGRGFPGLTVVLPTQGAAPAGLGTRQRSFYFGALFLVLSVALSGGYLFWRDVRRDVRLSSLRSQFVSSVSHELKTPLTAIRMFAETLRMGRALSPVDRDEYLDTIVNESERLTRLLNNVLDFSKIEQGRKIYRLEPHSVGAVVRSAARTMQYPLAQQGFELRVDIDDSLPDIASDPDALEQALLNLLNNAMKYSGSGRVIDLTLARDGHDAVVSVTDRGFGIPAAEHARIFEKFYRVPGAELQSIAGTGLGLTLVEHTVRAHGGRVTVRSAPGEGSTFSIVLPLEPVPTLHSAISHLQSQES